MSYRSRPISFGQDTFRSDYFEVKKMSSGGADNITFFCFKSPGRSGNGYNFRGIYKKNSNTTISERDACKLNDFLPVLRYKLFKDEKKGDHLGYRPLNEEEINCCIDTLKKEHGVDKIPDFNLNIDGKTVDFQETGINGWPVYKAHAFLTFKKNPSDELRNSLFFDSNGDNSYAVKKAGCNKANAINTVNIQGPFNSCSYWAICAANEVLMSAKNRTLETYLSSGKLHRNILKRFQYVQHCAETGIPVGKFTANIDELIDGLGLDKEVKYVGDSNKYLNQDFLQFIGRFQGEMNRTRQNIRTTIRPTIIKPIVRSRFPAHAYEDISHNTNQETTPVGGGFRGRIVKKGMPGKTVLNAKSLSPSFTDSFKIENIQRKARQHIESPKKETTIYSSDQQYSKQKQSKPQSIPIQKPEGSHYWRDKVIKSKSAPNLSKSEHSLS